MLLAILSVGDPGSTFSEGLNVTKVYMTFILAFVGITNIIVSCLVGSLLWLFVEVAHTQRFTGSTIYMIWYGIAG